MTIVLLETIHQDAHNLLASHDRVALVDSDGEREAMLTLTGDAVVAILTRGKQPIDAALLARCPDLRVVARCGVGLDNIDLVAARARAIPVVYAPGSTTNAVAEHTLMLMLAATRQLVPIAGAVRAGAWAVREGYQGQELTGKTLGIVGLGDIGKRVAELAERLGMRVIYWSRRQRDERYTYRTFEELLREADVVSLHIALNSETRHLLGSQQFMLLKPGAILINTARGAVIDQSALLLALERGQVGAFAADVLEHEPPAPDDPLLGHERVIITPHVAVLTDTTYREICMRTARNVLAILRGEAPESDSVYHP